MSAFDEMRKDRAMDCTQSRMKSSVIAFLLLAAASSAASAQGPRCPGLRALDGTCANVVAVDVARRRAMILSSERVSYWGTPAGTVGDQFIPFERLFRDNPLLFGLPTITTTIVDANFKATITRTK
jgi:hypothetical protein